MDHLSLGLLLGHLYNSTPSATDTPALFMGTHPATEPLLKIRPGLPDPITFLSWRPSTFWKITCLRINCSTSSTELPEGLAFRNACSIVERPEALLAVGTVLPAGPLGLKQC